MIDETLLSVLSCPETKKNLVLADEELIKCVNKRIASGEILTRNKKKVCLSIESGLLREGDDEFLYPIRNNVPVLLVEELLDIRG